MDNNEQHPKNGDKIIMWGHALIIVVYLHWGPSRMIVCTQLVLLPNHMHTYHKILLISVYSPIPQIWLMSFLLQSTTCLLMSSNGMKSTNTQLTELNFAVTSSHVDLSIAHYNAYSIVKVKFIINHSKVFYLIIIWM